MIPKPAAMLDRILVPLDGSQGAEAILHQLRALLRRRDAEVVIFQAILPRIVDASTLALERLRVTAEEYVQEVRWALSDAGVRARGRVLVGAPAQAILEAAEAEDATLIAMSTHGRTGVARWLFGSVAEKVVRASERPVLLVRSFRSGEGVTRADGEWSARKVLVPMDASVRSGEVVPYAIELANHFHGGILLLHVAESEGAGNAEASGEERLRAAARRVAEARLPVETRVERGVDAAAAILDSARRHGVDAVAMTAHGMSGPGRWVFGSVAEKVLRHADVPVLLVRAPR